MGADNFVNFDTWYKWKEIYKLLPIAIFDRPKYSNVSLSSKAAKVFLKNRYNENFSKKLSTVTPPAWIYFHGKLNYFDSHKIRKRNEK